MEPEPASNVITLDGDGDVVLVVQDAKQSKTRSFLAATKPLVLASPYFAAMFEPNFSEGVRLSEAREDDSGRPPAISLEEDDINSMDFILSLLHHKYDRVKSDVTAKQMAQIAISADKYQCKGALKGWTAAWFPVEPDLAARDSRCLDHFELGYRLLAAYLFRSPALGTMSEHYIKELPTAIGLKWADDDLLSRHLPKPFRDAIYCQIKCTNQQMRNLVHNALKDLLSARGVSADMRISVATSYINALEWFEVGPSMTSFLVSSPSKIAANIEEAMGDLTPDFKKLGDSWGFASDMLFSLVKDVREIRNEMEGMSLEDVIQADRELAENGGQ